MSVMKVKNASQATNLHFTSMGARMSLRDEGLRCRMSLRDEGLRCSVLGCVSGLRACVERVKCSWN
jgi:hypothetical protein